MSIPFYRYVCYTDDGCALHQCLNCYEKWECRGCGWRFCAYCGIKFDGQLQCRNDHEPAWLYRLKQQDIEKRDRWDHDRRMSENRLSRGWVIESRNCHESDGITTRDKWSVSYWQSNHGVTTLRMVIAHLASCRRIADTDATADRDWPWRSWTEYRARIIDFKDRPPFTCSTIWQHSNIPESTPLIEFLHPPAQICAEESKA